ncbi:hypothetical protein POM88_049591 [Heracleum sosnowskyi]|uniref:DUF4283 domain-containing protein n=1 Tax=Heracleum sosnowskyi TaxID=360622 RepID=A0AAD8GYI2_9APIA|nr:hypothetical protein POM88_049591 [Heracleum sosnowskyi]
MGLFVGTFTKKAASFKAVSDFARNLWSKSLTNVFQKDTNVFVFKFVCLEAMHYALSKGTWYIDRKPMVVTPWGADEAKPITSIPLWIKLSQIPDCYWTQDGLSRLASAVGEPLSADRLTQNLDMIPFAKFCVKYKLGDPLPNSITAVALDPVSGDKYNAEVRVSYFNKPLLCDSCHSLGHSVAACQKAKRIWVQKQKIDSNGSTGKSDVESSEGVHQGPSPGSPIDNPTVTATTGNASMVDSSPPSQDEWTTVKPKKSKINLEKEVTQTCSLSGTSVPPLGTSVVPNVPPAVPIFNSISRSLSKSQRNQLRKSSRRSGGKPSSSNK